MTAMPRYSAGGRFIGLAGSSPDVTERRDIELAREQLLESERSARNEAESMARLKDEFLATLSHELRTPLTTILGWSELLLQRLDASDPSHKGLSVIASSARAQKRLISDMLDLSGMLLGKVQLEVETLNLGEQLREAMRLAGAGGRRARRSTDQPALAGAALPGARRPHAPAAGALEPAVEHDQVHPGARPYRGDRWCTKSGHFVISIRDTGDGIPPEFLPHLFGRFSQADGTTTRRARRPGPRAWRSCSNWWRCMAGRSPLPAKAPARERHSPCACPNTPTRSGQAAASRLRRSLASEQVVEAKALNGLRLLVVEDQPDMRDYLRRLLEEHGAEVVVVANATDALELLDDGAHARFDVMLTDIGMPGMDGYGLIRTIRENMGLSATALPAVAVTALARNDDRRRALASGFQGHLAKPYSVAQLVAAVVMRARCDRAALPP
ncbi:MAG: response regulator [Nibricoccus sp.]